MKKFLNFVTISALTINGYAQNGQATIPSFLAPVRQAANTNKPSESDLLKAARKALLSAPADNRAAARAVPATNATNVAVRYMPTEEQVRRKRVEKAGRLLALNSAERERRTAANVVTTNETGPQVSAVADKRFAQSPPAPAEVRNAAAKTAKRRSGKHAPPPVFVAADSVTNYATPGKPAETYVYRHEVWVPKTSDEVARSEEAKELLFCKRVSVWGFGSTSQSAPSQSPEYVVDQRPLDQGSSQQPVYQPTYSSSYLYPSYYGYGGYPSYYPSYGYTLSYGIGLGYSYGYGGYYGGGRYYGHRGHGWSGGRHGGHRR